MSNVITISGFAAADAEFRFTPNGKPVLNVSIPENHGYKDQQTGEWVDKGTTWRAVELWGDDAEYAAEHIRKGDLIQATGREEIEVYQKKDGTPGAKIRFKAFQVAKVLKAPRQPQGSQQGGYQAGGQQGWNQQAPRQGGQRLPENPGQSDPWQGVQQQSYDWSTGQDDQPPF